MDIRVVRVWEKRCLVHIDGGEIAFQVGFKLRIEDNYLSLLPPKDVHLSRGVLNEIRNLLWIKIGENENAEQSAVLS